MVEKKSNITSFHLGFHIIALHDKFVICGAGKTTEEEILAWEIYGLERERNVSSFVMRGLWKR